MTSPFWTPPLQFSGERVFILGGGPSLTQEDVDRLNGRNVIAVNCAGFLAAWAPYLFFNDSGWFAKFRKFVESFEGVAVSTSRVAVAAQPHKVKRILVEHRHDFPEPGSGVVRQGRTSGHKAVSLAIAMGGARVVLLGFDMREIDGRSHFHDEYRCRDPQLYELSFIPAFRGWNDAALRRGVAIVNATPGSALQEFPMTTLDAELM